MDGREPVGISYTPSNVANKADEAEFNRWYKEVHFVDVVKGKVLMNPIMFHHALATVPPGGDRFIIMYELYYKDLEEGQREFSKFTPKLLNDYDQTKGIRSPNRGQYKVFRRMFANQGPKRSQSFYAERLNAKDPAQAAALEKWYTDVRLPELMASGLFHTGSFGGSPRGEARTAVSPTASRYLGLFESSSSDALKLKTDAQRHSPLSKLHPNIVVAETVAAKRDSA